jgi:uncharacterized protein
MGVRNWADEQKIIEFCKKHHILQFAFYGSVLRDDFCDSSDIDVLVVFLENQVPGFFKLAQMEDELSRLFGRKVDLRTPADLSKYFRNEVLQCAEVQYAA